MARDGRWWEEFWFVSRNPNLDCSSAFLPRTVPSSSYHHPPPRQNAKHFPVHVTSHFSSSYVRPSEDFVALFDELPAVDACENSLPAVSTVMALCPPDMNDTSKSGLKLLFDLTRDPRATGMRVYEDEWKPFQSSAPPPLSPFSRNRTSD